MKCPVCNDVNLVMSERQGIEIDYCPDCRGVWLDRGELDKIIERSASPQSGYEPQRSQSQHQEHRSHYEKHGKNRKHKSFLSELFD